MTDQKQLREHLLKLLDGASAHIDLESALIDFPPERINERPAGSPHCPWSVLYLAGEARRQPKAQRVSAGSAYDREGQSYRR